MTEEQYTLWTEDYGSANYVYHATDGNWYDGSGREYEKTESGSWESQGKTWTEETPQAPEDTAVDEVQVADSLGTISRRFIRTVTAIGQMERAVYIYPMEMADSQGPDGSVWN